MHIGLEGDYLRVGKQYCQVLSLVEQPHGTRPDLFGPLLSIDCPMVWCSVWQRKAGSTTRQKAAAVENAVGMAGQDIWTAVVGGYNPNIPPPRRASTKAQEKKVEDVGDILIDLDGRHYYGHYSLFGLVHSRDKEQVETALPRVQNMFNDPAEAGLLEENAAPIGVRFVLPWPAIQCAKALVARGSQGKSELRVQSLLRSPVFGGLKGRTHAGIRDPARDPVSLFSISGR